MKNKKFFLIIGVIIIVTIIVIVFCINIGKSYRDELDDKYKQIIAEKSYINFAWGFQYSGMAIFNDGTIYKWNFEGSHIDYKVNNLEEHRKWILEHGSKVGKKVSENDLQESEKIAANLENNIDLKNTAYDAGSNSISVWNADGKKITLKESGDYSGENKSNEAQRLISIISKYLK